MRKANITTTKHSGDFSLWSAPGQRLPVRDSQPMVASLSQLSSYARTYRRLPAFSVEPRKVPAEEGFSTHRPLKNYIKRQLNVARSREIKTSGVLECFARVDRGKHLV
jgi:hypothetical protein